jgi:hypothetical protein
LAPFAEVLVSDLSAVIKVAPGFFEVVAKGRPAASCCFAEWRVRRVGIDYT